MISRPSTSFYLQFFLGYSKIGRIFLILSVVKWGNQIRKTCRISPLPFHRLKIFLVPKFFYFSVFSEYFKCLIFGDWWMRLVLWAFQRLFLGAFYSLLPVNISWIMTSLKFFDFLFYSWSTHYLSACPFLVWATCISYWITFLVIVNDIHF